VKKPIEQGGLSLEEIYHSLIIANRIIFKNWQNRFVYGQLPHGRALNISRVCYYLCRRTPTEEAKTNISNIIKTNSWLNFGYQYERMQDPRWPRTTEARVDRDSQPTDYSIDLGQIPSFDIQALGQTVEQVDTTLDTLLNGST